VVKYAEQFCLHGKGEFANLIEKNGASVVHCKFADKAVLVSTAECSRITDGKALSKAFHFSINAGLSPTISEKVKSLPTPGFVLLKVLGGFL